MPGGKYVTSQLQVGYQLLEERIRKQTGRAVGYDFALKSEMKTICLSVTSLVALFLFAPSSFAQYAGVAKHREHERHIKQHLARLSSMDFRVLTERQWDKLKHSHTNDVVVHWPDGRRTKGLGRHLRDLKAMFAYAPDIRIRAQSVMFESDDWTCVITEMEGTFTRPMPTSHGKEIPPSRKRFKISMCAVGHWNQKGLMDEEHLFWDNQSLMQQIGVATSTPD